MRGTKRQERGTAREERQRDRANWGGERGTAKHEGGTEREGQREGQLGNMREGQLGRDRERGTTGEEREQGRTCEHMSWKTFQVWERIKDLFERRTQTQLNRKRNGQCQCSHSNQHNVQCNRPATREC